jgi:hypothetical protein
MVFSTKPLFKKNLLKSEAKIDSDKRAGQIAAQDSFLLASRRLAYLWSMLETEPQVIIKPKKKK